MKINILPQTIANMIAAGEVVERPASVVKELVENSVDAGASAITVEVQKGGMAYIRVTDDGCGIAPDQVETAFLRHATSKIRTEEDLNAIYTLGFRGEALASIAAVARVDIFTKTADNEFGRCLSIEGGTVTESDDAGCADGTTIIVRDLFFNTPARMKFLKNDATETGYITDAVNKLILSHPEVKIKLIVNGKITVSSSGDGKLSSAIYTVYGRDYPKHMIPVDYSDGGIDVKGYIGTSALARKDRRQQVFFINGRYITSKVISAALSEAFQNTVMVGKYPVAVLMIKVNGNFVDVNVHPTKIEVRFSDDKKVYHSVYWAIKNALSVKKYVPEVESGCKSAEKLVINARNDAVKEKNKATQIDINFLRDEVFKPKPQPQKSEISNSLPTQEAKLPEVKTDRFEKEIPQHISNNSFFAKEDLSNLKMHIEKESHIKAGSDLVKTTPSAEATDLAHTPADKQAIFDKDVPLAEDPKPETSQLSTETIYPHKEVLKPGIDFNVIGQVFATYILVQKDSDMIIIDQHAAHERIYFEELLEEYKSRTISTQILLLPVTVDFEPTQYPLVKDNLEFYASLGFECEEFGETTIAVRAIPAALKDADIKDTVTEIADLLDRGCADIKKNLAEEALHTMACKRAIKGNSILTKAEMETLCEKVFSFNYINTCPHGRPISVKMSKYEMEKQFKRIV